MASDKVYRATKSLLDTDFYKFTMMYSVFMEYRNETVEYAFKNRSPEMKLNKDAFEWLKKQIALLSDLRLSQDEIKFLRKHCTTFHDSFFSFLETYKLCPEKQIKCELIEDNLTVSINGLWMDTILYEVVIMSLISEAYFKYVDTDWDYTGQLESARSKCQQLIKNGCRFSEFGTRRRRDYYTHDLVIQGLIEESKSLESNLFIGTSNVHLARIYDLLPCGTIAHEWFMAIAAIKEDYVSANKIALNEWMRYQPYNHRIALSDTFGLDNFFESFTNTSPNYLASNFSGIRHDSGDVDDFLKRCVKHYRDTKISPQDKVVVFSNNLNVNTVEQLQKKAKDLEIRVTFGIGTFLTNDFRKKSNPSEASKPMNIVIKMVNCAGKNVIKLTEDSSKASGDAVLIEEVRKQLKEQKPHSKTDTRSSLRHLFL